MAEILNPNPATEIPEANSSKQYFLNYFVALIALAIGLVLGYFLYSSLNGGNSVVVNTPLGFANTTSSLITLPPDAVVLQSCSDHKGKLYAKPADIPVGPVYMVYNGKVIGLEYMLAKEDFLNGKSFEFLEGLDMKVDHVNVGLLSQGHEGYPVPHYHVDLYNVSKAEEKAIKCPSAPTSSLATPSAQVASQSATR